uniref:Uncharacterized protein n=2 Tax=Bursaphelenchus xylophilus TaxID=6326 RepID=A0A1I7S8A5_BURXY
MYRWWVASLTVLLNFVQINGQSVKCFSCASEDMRQDFLNRPRGPQGRVKLPKVFDNMCDWDLWLLREKAVVDCNGVCFKWQQTFNNSGTLTYSTIRGCHPDMFNKPAEIKQGQLSHCRRNNEKVTCLDFSEIAESYCECVGDHCNSGYLATASYFLSSLLILSLFA